MEIVNHWFFLINLSLFLTFQLSERMCFKCIKGTKCRSNKSSILRLLYSFLYNSNPISIFQCKFKRSNLMMHLKEKKCYCLNFFFSETRLSIFELGKFCFSWIRFFFSIFLPRQGIMSTYIKHMFNMRKTYL